MNKKKSGSNNFNKVNVQTNFNYGNDFEYSNNYEMINSNNEDIEINNNEEMINDNIEEENENLDNIENNPEFYRTNNFDFSQGQNVPLNFDYKSRTSPDFARFNESIQNKNFSQSDINFENISNNN